ncbi:MAG: class I SAM-dependent methyltransferase [Alphaproteobacteria bacterium]|nr:class I SAM-dependent methyltransferase [Alphaproteobacteria bacterium]
MRTLITSLTELRRHLVLKLTGRPGVSLIGNGNAGRSHLEKQTPSDRFEAIYADGVWQNGDRNTPKSGPGSSLQATDGLRWQLPNVLGEIAAKTLLDVGCGDFTWMNRIELRQNYIGVDIVTSVIADNARYAGPKRQFFCIDAISGQLPEADTILCRETLFHLSFEDGGGSSEMLFPARDHGFSVRRRATLGSMPISTPGIIDRSTSAVLRTAFLRLTE